MLHAGVAGHAWTMAMHGGVWDLQMALLWLVGAGSKRDTAARKKTEMARWQIWQVEAVEFQLGGARVFKREDR